MWAHKTTSIIPEQSDEQQQRIANGLQIVLRPFGRRIHL